MSEKNSSSWQEKVLDPVAAHIGKRIRDRREVLGLTSDDVARRVGMSLQQAEECEKGCVPLAGRICGGSVRFWRWNRTIFSSVCRKKLFCSAQKCGKSASGKNYTAYR